MRPDEHMISRGNHCLTLLAFASLVVGCDRSLNTDEVRMRAQTVVSEAEATATALLDDWKQLVADVKASAVSPDPSTPCAVDPRPKPAMRTAIAMSTGITSMSTESVLDRRFRAGSYYVTPSKEIDGSYSPGAAKLKGLISDLLAVLNKTDAKPEELYGAVREIQRLKPRYEGLILIDEVEAPRITDPAKSFFQPGFAIGRAYLFDHETGNVVCFASVTAENKPEVTARTGLDRAFLEIDLAEAVFEAVEERWVTAHKR